MTGKYRVLLVDDHTLVRQGIRALLATMDDVEVVGESGDGLEAMNAVREHRPDVVLLDIAMPGLNGLEAAARITKEFPATRILVLSMHGTEAHVAQALRAGASGYLLKGADVAEFAAAIRAVAQGGTYLTPAISKQLVADYVRRLDGGADEPPLTGRQREILQLVAEGRSSKEIARRLDISLKTVEAHRTALMRRLGIHDVAGLVRYAVRSGLVAP